MNLLNFTDLDFNQECTHGRPQGGGQNGHLPPLAIEAKKQKFLENVKSGM